MEPNSSKEIERHYKILVLGDTKSGKSSVIQRYCDNSFLPVYDPTHGKYYNGFK